MDEHIITITEYEFGHGWKMTINLKELAESAGMKKEMKANYGIIENYKYKVTSVPMPRAKKILRLIRQHGTEKDWEACDKYLASNPRLYKAWKEIRA